MNHGRRLIAFYEERGPDDRGRFLDDILCFSDEQLEYVHDFIQWLFPLPERSGANPSAPILDDAAIAEFRRRQDLRAALRRSLDRMLAFYGFTWSGDRIVKAPSFSERSRNWLRSGNHNHLRLTRVLRSLRVLGEPQAARTLFDLLSDIYDEERRAGHNSIARQSFEFWQNAVEA